MANDDTINSMEELDKGFELLTDPAGAIPEVEEARNRERDWKQNDPEGYKADMVKMCKEMFGDRWEVEYQAMLEEEFPE